jgi:hypothetical protein
MTTAWKIKHDPLELMNRECDWALLEEAAREQGEDIVQAERTEAGAKKVLDLGWYGSGYQVLLVERDWSSPIKKIEARDLKSAIIAFRQLAV